MEVTVSAFPFQKLRYDKYLTLEAMMYVERSKSLEFMFSVNRETRKFLQKEYITIQNGFVNEGLIVFKFSNDFKGYEQLDRLYLEALNRNPCNRILTIDVNIWDYDDFSIFKEVVRWIKA